jgi:hypothetical protein
MTGVLCYGIRRCAEILLALGRADETRQSLTATHGPNIKTFLLVLDEFLDKDMTSILLNIRAFLKLLVDGVKIGREDGASPPVNVEVQCFIIAHSEKVVKTCADEILVLSYGKIFDFNSAGNVRYPFGMAWI